MRDYKHFRATGFRAWIVRFIRPTRKDLLLQVNGLRSFNPWRH